MSKAVSSPIRLGIVIPTYNESKNITLLIKRIKAITKQVGVYCCVLIVDDNSPDGTGNIADKLVKQEKSASFKVQVLHRQLKQGIGKAYIEGFQKLLQDDFTHIIQMDGDLSHDPKYIIYFLKASQKSDLIIGSRYISGGATPDWVLHRRLLSIFGNIYARMFLGSRIHDYTGGYNMYTTQLLKTINPSTISATGYGFQIELKYRSLNHCKLVTEIPIIFKERQNGISKIPKNTLISNLILVPKLKLANRNSSQRKNNSLVSYSKAQESLEEDFGSNARKTK